MDSKAEKYMICVNDVEKKNFVTGIGHSAWGGIEEVKENEKESFLLEEVKCIIDDKVVILENKGHVRKFEILEKSII